MRLLIYILPMLIGATLFGRTNAVRTVEAWPEGAISGKENWSEAVEAAKRGFDGGSNNLEQCEVIAWCVKLDHLDCPPRLSEEAIMMINCIVPGRTNSWALAYIGRKPSGGALDRSWNLFDYQRPLVNFATFPTRPDEKHIATFIKATNFGYSDFYPDRLVLDVVLYHKSTIIESGLKAGLPESEKQRRHAAHLKSIPY